MKQVLLLTLLVFLCFPSSARADETELDQLIGSLTEGRFKDREAARVRIVQYSVENLGETVRKIDAALKSRDPELRVRASELIESLYRLHELGEGLAYHGMELGWFLDHPGESHDLSSWPLVVSVAKGSPAETAGVLPGDVITKFQGIETRDLNSRNNLVAKLVGLKPGAKVRFEISRSGDPEAYSSYHKTKTVRPEFALEASPKNKKVEAVDQETVKKWFQQNLKRK